MFEEGRKASGWVEILLAIADNLGRAHADGLVYGYLKSAKQATGALL